MKQTVLCVDDDIAILNVLDQLLHEDYYVITHTLPEKALSNIISDPSIILVISDHRMPGMTGLEMFRRLKELSPGREIYSIIYSGFSEVEHLMEEMINSKVINEFMTKTCPSNKLLTAVERGIKKMSERLKSH